MKWQFIPPLWHGIFDYLTAATLPFCPRMLGFRRSTTTLIDAVAGTVAANEMLTKNEVGLVKAMPMKAHLAMDCLTGGMLLTTAAFMDDDEPLERAVVAGIGIHLLAQACLTSPTAISAPTRDTSSRPSPMERYAEGRRSDAARQPGEMQTVVSGM